MTNPSTDLAVTTDTPKDVEVPFDDYYSLITQLDAARDTLKHWEDQVEELERLVQKHMGDNGTVATLHGKARYTWKRISRMRVGDFKKDHPDLHQAYTHDVTKSEFDVKLFERAQPELYRQYQSRQFLRS